ncbi:MAG: leucine-rich repeat domain-containing protein [Verrucomicrobia bacterium]|nr:leucine-rich repeat domain-containing protein [Verrucomicrobiota bacterium]
MTNTFSRLTALMAFSPAVLFFTSFQISAAVDDIFIIGDLKYTVLTEEGSTGTVAINKNDFISGDLIIPSSVKNNAITYSVTSIGNWAFMYCNHLTSITIPDSVTSIGGEAFEYCSSLTSITIPDSVTSIKNMAFYSCSSLTSITIPDSVTSIGDGAFYNCSSLTSVTIGKGVISIRDDAFEYCSSLTSITIPDSVTSLGAGAFENCSSLTSVTIGKGVTSIRDCAFKYCSSLTSITIPDSVTFIGIEAFSGCDSLTSITIPDSVTLIESWAFADCSSLTSVYFEGNAPNIEYKGLFDNTPATIYYRAGTEGWTDPWCGRPTELWGETPEDEPVIRFELEGDGESLVLNFAGTLYESDDAVNWHLVEGAKAPFKVYTSKGKKFYRCAQ